MVFIKKVNSGQCWECKSPDKIAVIREGNVNIGSFAYYVRCVGCGSLLSDIAGSGSVEEAERDFKFRSGWMEHLNQKIQDYDTKKLIEEAREQIREEKQAKEKEHAEEEKHAAPDDVPEGSQDERELDDIQR